MRWLAALWIGLAAATACGSDPGDALVVVQETNVPDPPPPCDGYAHDYTVDYVRDCDDSGMQVHVCADEELCQAQLEEIVEPLASCDAIHGYEIEIPDGC